MAVAKYSVDSSSRCGKSSTRLYTGAVMAAGVVMVLVLLIHVTLLNQTMMSPMPHPHAEYPVKLRPGFGWK